MADSVAALAAPVGPVQARGGLTPQTIDPPLDAAPPGDRGRRVGAGLKIHAVSAVERTRIRRAGNRYCADLTVGLARNVTFQRSDQVVAEISTAVHDILPDADVVIHSVPRETGHENLFDRIRAVASRNNLSVHD